MLAKDQSSSTLLFFQTIFTKGLAAHPDAAINLCYSAGDSGAMDSFCLTREPAQAAATVIANPDANLFVKISLYSLRLMEKRRQEMQGKWTPGTKDELLVVPGIGLDTDCDKGPGYLTQPEMLRAIALMPIDPTLIVETKPGGSMHVWWVFNQPLLIGSEVQYQYIQAVCKAWRNLLHDSVRRIKPDGILDQISAPDRVLRPVGAMRGDQPVKLLRAGGPEADFEKLKLWVSGEVSRIQSIRKAPGGEPRANSIISQYLDDNDIALSDLLADLGCDSTGAGQWQREDAAGPASPRSAVEYFDENTNRWGITVHSQNWERFPTHEDGSTPWYSDVHVFVNSRFEGDWSAAARWCLGQRKPADVFDVQQPIQAGETASRRGVLRNYERPNKTAIGIPLPELLQQVHDWKLLQTCKGSIFAVESAQVMVLDTVAKLFAFLNRRMQVDWVQQGVEIITKAEFYEGIQQTAPRYDSIEVAPHFPPLEHSYYLNQIEVGDIQDLYDWIDHFSPESWEDRELMIGASVTPFWGVRGGIKPLFAVTSESAQGAGKTTLVESVGRLTGLGETLLYQFRDSSELDLVAKSLLNTAALSPESKRVILADNYRGSKLGGAMVESLITADWVSGWKNYQGDTRIPNTFVWFAAGNDLQMTEDLATRAVPIRLRQAQWSGAWERKLRSWDIRKVVAGIRAWFEQLQPAPVQRVTRFGRWCDEILGRLQHPDMLVEHIQANKVELSVQSDQLEETMKVVRGILMAYEANPAAEKVITGQMAADEFNIKKASGVRAWSPQYAGQRLSELARNCGSLEKMPRSGTKRGYRWTEMT